MFQHTINIIICLYVHIHIVYTYYIYILFIHIHLYLLYTYISICDYMYMYIFHIHLHICVYVQTYTYMCVYCIKQPGSLCLTDAPCARSRIQGNQLLQNAMLQCLGVARPCLDVGRVADFTADFAAQSCYIDELILSQ